MAQKHQTKISRARFVVSPFTASQMVEIGQSAISSIFENWNRGLDVSDAPAPPLAMNYAKVKLRTAGSSVRDLNRTGRLRRSIKVLAANENKVTIGPADGMHTRLKRGGQLSFSDVLTLNQRRWRMWGLSPSGRAKLVSLLSGARPVRAEATRAA